jgi:hypothetical protein
MLRSRTARKLRGTMYVTALGAVPAVLLAVTQQQRSSTSAQHRPSTS